MRLKVLKHTTYNPHSYTTIETRLLQQLNDYYEEITPVYYRTGEYLYGDKCWFEVRGRAFKLDKDQFMYNLNMLKTEEIGFEVIKCLIEIERLNSKVLNEEQRKLIYDYASFLYRRKLNRKSLKRTKDMIKRLRKKKSSL